MLIKILKLDPNATIPKYQTPGSAGFDLHALEDVTIEPGQTKPVRTGLAFDVGPGYELQIRPRSGLSLKTPLRVANSPGTVDSDFRAEVAVLLWNSSTVSGPNEALITIKIKKGDRIAQGVVCPIVQADMLVVDYLDDTIRGKGGFGSTGTN
jgi:dUTP pyrophosphatase